MMTTMMMMMMMVTMMRTVFFDPGCDDDHDGDDDDIGDDAEEQKLGVACGVTILPALIQPMTAKVPSRPSHTGVRACLRQFRRRT